MHTPRAMHSSNHYKQPLITKSKTGGKATEAKKRNRGNWGNGGHWLAGFPSYDPECSVHMRAHM